MDYKYVVPMARLVSPDVLLNRRTSNHCAKWRSTADNNCCKKLHIGTSRKLPVENLHGNQAKIWIRPDGKIAKIRPDPELVPSLTVTQALVSLCSYIFMMTLGKEIGRLCLLFTARA